MKKFITKKEAKEVWEKIKDNKFLRLHFPTFKYYWKDCQRINNLPEKEWEEMYKKNLDKINNL